jgi:hypothetical protein
MSSFAAISFTRQEAGQQNGWGRATGPAYLYREESREFYFISGGKLQAGIDMCISCCFLTTF